MVDGGSNIIGVVGPGQNGLDDMNKETADVVDVAVADPYGSLKIPRRQLIS